LFSWSICPECASAFPPALACPSCDEESSGAGSQLSHAEPSFPMRRLSSSSGGRLGLIFGCLGLIPLAGVGFSIAGAIISAMAIGRGHREGRSAALAGVGLGVSLATIVPGSLWLLL